MTVNKVSISLEAGLLGWADELVQQGTYDSRSAVMEAGLEALYRQRMDERLDEALAALTAEDVAEGITLAEMGADEWLRELDAVDGGWGSNEPKRAAG